MGCGPAGAGRDVPSGEGACGPGRAAEAGRVGPETPGGARTGGEPRRTLKRSGQPCRGRGKAWGVTAVDECERSKLVHLLDQTTPESNGEGWEEVEMAEIGTLYSLPFITGVLMCEVGEFFGWERDERNYN